MKRGDGSGTGGGEDSLCVSGGGDGDWMLQSYHQHRNLGISRTMVMGCWLEIGGCDGGADGGDGGSSADGSAMTARCLNL